MEWIQITAEYSNAVLLAVLPLTSDFAIKLDLPVPIPITVNHVERFVCMPWKGNPGGYVTLTNGYEFWYGHGYMMGFRTPHSYYNLQDPAHIPKFYGPLRVSESEALRLARDALKKLGYTLKETFADQEPNISMPPRIGTNVVPHYRFKWQEPLYNKTAVDIEVDGTRGIIQNLWLSSMFFWRDPPDVGVAPKLREPAPAISSTTSNEFVARVLPNVTEFAKRLRLKLTLPVAPEQIKRVEFVGTDQTALIQLRNGFWFTWENGNVRGFNSPDSIYGRHPADQPCPLGKYLGKSQMSESQAIELARDTILRLGHRLEDFGATGTPVVSSPKPVGKYVVPRYFFQWLVNDKKSGATLSVAWVEVDAGKKMLKHAYVSRELAAADTSAARLPSNAFEKIAAEETEKSLDHAIVPGTNAPQKRPPPTQLFKPYE